MREWEGVGGGGGGRGDFRQQTEQSQPQVVLWEIGTEAKAKGKSRTVPVTTLGSDPIYLIAAKLFQPGVST